MLLGCFVSEESSCLAYRNSTLRLGDYLAVATLGVSEIIHLFIVNGGSLTNGAAGILGISLTLQLGKWFVLCRDYKPLQPELLCSPLLFNSLSVR